MGKTTRTLSGAGRDKYFRERLAAQHGVAPEAASALSAQFAREIAHIRVRLPLAPAGAPPSQTVSQTGSQAEQAVDQPDNSIQLFDPFAFSAVVVMTKEGRGGLAKLLQAIDTADNLRALAKAQHVALPKGLDSPQSIRTAILDGVEKRIGNRRAAAS